jgi:integrase
VRDTVRRSTYVRYEGLVRNHIKPSIGRMKLKGLTPTHVRSLYRKKLDSGLAPRSVNYIHVTLHKALEQTVLDGLVPRNVAEGVKAPQVRKEEVKPLSHSGTGIDLSSKRGSIGSAVPSSHTYRLATR